MAWSSSDKPSRSDPCAARAISATAPASCAMFSAVRICSMRARNQRRRQRFQVELQTARQHRHRNLLRIGRGQHEAHVLGRLLERLQHRVERGLGQHVHFVDQVDLVAADGRRVARVVENLPHVVDAGVGRGVELEQVDEAPGVDLGARRADAARRGGDARHAIEALGEDARDRGLAHPAGAGQQVRVVNAAARQRIGERRHHVLLAGQLRERHRPPLAREDLVTHS